MAVDSLTDLNSGTNQNSVKCRWILMIFGCKYCNTRRLANSPAESADGTSYFVTEIKHSETCLNEDTIPFIFRGKLSEIRLDDTFTLKIIALH